MTPNGALNSWMIACNGWQQRTLLMDDTTTHINIDGMSYREIETAVNANPNAKRIVMALLSPGGPSEAFKHSLTIVYYRGQCHDVTDDGVVVRVQRDGKLEAYIKSTHRPFSRTIRIGGRLRSMKERGLK
jgi:hypothetical protein